MTPENLLTNWNKVVEFNENATYPNIYYDVMMNPKVRTNI
jgi:hypothetical protein